MSLVAALDRRSAIGRDQQLPWRLPDDLKRFKALTLGKTTLMGRKTAEALGRALPGRRNLVLTRSGQAPYPGMDVVGSIDEGLAQAAGEELMVIGGGEIYSLFLPVATSMHLTHVETEVAGADAFFPAFDEQHWIIVAREPHPADARHACAFKFVDYRRR